MEVAVDNDILLKGACYGLLREFCTALSSNLSEIGILGAARYVVASAIGKAALTKDKDGIRAAFLELLATTEVLEPSADELKLAAVLELSAQKAHLPLDAGESQLVAIVVRRGITKLATGDKRAISAMATLQPTHGELECLVGRVVCLEHIVALCVEGAEFAPLRQAICAEPSVDKALTNCFACRSEITEASAVIEGLLSYLGDLERRAPNLLSRT